MQLVVALAGPANDVTTMTVNAYTEGSEHTQRS